MINYFASNTNPCAGCGKPIHRHRLAQTCWPCTHLAQSIRDAAGRLVAAAVKRGELQKASDCACVDCAHQALDYDHRAYRLPLAVEPVCRGCNVKRGNATDLHDLIRERLAA